jgi:hypothetical protein
MTCPGGSSDRGCGMQVQVAASVVLFRSGVVASAGDAFTRPNRHGIEPDVSGWSAADRAPHRGFIGGIHKDKLPAMRRWYASIAVSSLNGSASIRFRPRAEHVPQHRRQLRSDPSPRPSAV